jgi:hypothetical protein
LPDGLAVPAEEPERLDPLLHLSDGLPPLPLIGVFHLHLLLGLFSINRLCNRL